MKKVVTCTLSILTLIVWNVFMAAAQSIEDRVEGIYAEHARGRQESDKPNAKKTVSTARKAKNIQLENSLLWEISGKGLIRPSYLFGTMHVICREDYIWLPEMQDAFDNTSELILELDMGDLDNFYSSAIDSMSAFFLESIDSMVNADSFSMAVIDTAIVVESTYFESDSLPGNYADDFSVAAVDTAMFADSAYAEEGIAVPPPVIEEAIDVAEEWSKAVEHHSFSHKGEYDDTNLDREHVYRSPFIYNDNEYVNKFLGEDLFKKYGLWQDDLDCAVQESYEMNLVTLAQKADKEISGLETINDQLRALSALDEYEEDSPVQQQAAESDDVIKLLTRAYKAQDITELYSIVSTYTDGLYSLDAILFTRNKNWVKALPELMKTSPKFIAVGVGHLGGEEGLINLLRKEGYTVTPIYNIK